MVKLGSIVWLIVSLITAGYSGYFAYGNVEKFTNVVDLLATIISILIGVSLAVIAVITSPFSVSANAAANAEEAERMTRLVKGDDEVLVTGQIIFFWIYFGALAFALVFKWVAAGESPNFSDSYLKLLACVTASIGVFAFMWSARLPLVLQRISSQRRSLG